MPWSMDTPEGVFWIVLTAFVAVAIVTFAALQRVSAPYGRHERAGWGPRVSATLGWVLMEAPSPVGVALGWWFAAPDHRTPPSLVFLLLWSLHYVHRAFIFPFRRRGGQNTMPASIAAMAILFNTVNAWLQSRWLFELGPVRDTGWLTDPRFLVGTALFLGGYLINQHADHVLFKLRKPGETGYKIPHGGLYGLVSCPNYLGELIEWFGWALLTWSPAGLAFAVWTAANLVPRARTNHQWYLDRFPDYPAARRAILPWLY